MPELISAETGLPEKLSDEQAAQALAAQTHGFAPGQTVSVVSNDGTRFDVPADKVGDAFALGARLEGDAEQHQRIGQAQYGEGIGNEIKAGLAGAARGATFGLSDLALTKTGLVNKETLAGLKEFNPIASTAGEVAGAVAPALLSGGSSAVASGAELAGSGVRAVSAIGGAAERGVAALIGGGTEAAAKGLARRVLESAVSKGAGSAVEGAFYGAGQLVSEEALGDTNLTAQKALAHIGLAAALGGATGGLFGAGEELVGAGLVKGAEIVKEKLGTGGLGEKIDNIAEEQAVKSLNATQSKIGKLQDKGRLEEVGRDLLTEQESLGGRKILDKYGNMEKTAANIDAVKESAGKQIGESIKTLSKAAEEAGEHFDGARVAEKLRGELMTEELQSPMFASERKQVEQLLSDLEEHGTSTLEKANKLKQALQKRASKEYDKLAGQHSFAGELDLSMASAVRQEIEDVAKRAAEAKGIPQAFDQLREGNRLFGSMSEAEKLVTQGLARKQGNRAISLTDTIGGAGSLAGMLGSGAAFGPAALGGLATSVAHKVVRERGNAIAANFIDHMRSLATVERAAQATTKRIDDAVSTFLTREGRGAVGKSVRDKLVPTATSVLGDVSFGDKSIANDSDKSKKTDDFDQRAQELAQMAADPTKLAERLARNFSGISKAAPKITSAAMQTAQNAAAFLHAKAPKPPLHTDVALPLKKTWKPSKLETAKWSRYVRAAEDPLSVLDDMHRGTIAPEGMETLKAIYPELHKEVVATVTDHYQKLEGDLPYSKRLALSRVIGAPLEPTMRPQFVAAMQSSYAQQSQQSQQQEQGAPVGAVNMTASGLSKISVASRGKTSSERVLSRTG